MIFPFFCILLSLQSSIVATRDIIIITLYLHYVCNAPVHFTVGKGKVDLYV